MATSIDPSQSNSINDNQPSRGQKPTANPGSVTKVMNIPSPKSSKQSSLSVYTPYDQVSNQSRVVEALDLSPPDFDLLFPRQYFKSDFARSLSLKKHTSSNQSKSMDFIDTTNPNGDNRNSLSMTATTMANRKCAISDAGGNGIRSTERFSMGVCQVPPIPARRQTIETSTVIPTASQLFRNVGSVGAGASGNGGNVVNRVIATNGNGNMNGATYRLSVPNGNGSFARRNACWPPAAVTASSGEQECRLLDEADHEIKINGDTEFPENRFGVSDPSSNVELVILQNQLDTLQWQLKQSETSCGMYRAVMEEVGRFFERFQKNSSLCRNEQISRSKSLHQVYGGTEKATESSTTSAYLRTRSSTNLIDLKRSSPSSFGSDSRKGSGKDHYDLATPINSCNVFKDLTWRRSPKKRGEQKLSASDEAEEKLVKEAYRLSRTINNLLNTQQPDLTQHRQLLNPRNKQINSNINAMPDSTAHHQKANLAAEMLFLRTANVRDSRLSLRSSTDCSVHSTSSSSKLETDEDNYSPPLLSKQCSNLCSTTEDESGFSSISSFHEIGVPLSSTMVSSSVGSTHADDTIDPNDRTIDSRNSTLKSSTVVSSANNVGVPLTNDANRWDSKTYRNSKFQRFSTLSNDDSAAVLWV